MSEKEKKGWQKIEEVLKNQTEKTKIRSSTQKPKRKEKERQKLEVVLVAKSLLPILG